MSILFAMFLFAFVMSISPGPVNIVILSSGINYGIRSTLPYVSGATIGLMLLLLLTGFVFEQFIKDYPLFLTAIAMGGSLYIMYMGYKIAASRPDIDVNKQNVPKFYEGFLMQWLNPKAWLACVSGVSLFVSAQSDGALLTFTSIYFPVCYVSLTAWAILGDKVSFLLQSHSRLRFFNISIGGLLIVTAVYLLYTHLT